MTQAELQLCSLLLREHFGDIVAAVGEFLVRAGSAALHTVLTGTGLRLPQVRRALCVLLQQQLAVFEAQPRGAVHYAVRCGRVLRVLRYPRYIYTAKALYGDSAELVVEELLLHGCLSMSAAVRQVADRLTDTMQDGQCMDYSDVVSAFTRLVDTHFVQRCPRVPDGVQDAPPPAAPTLVISDKDMYTLPNISIVGKGKRRRSCDEEEGGGPSAKKQKQNRDGAAEPPPDDGIYWQVNVERFHQHFRDQAIVSAVANRVDQPSSEIVRTMLRLSEVTTASGAAHTQPLSAHEIFRALPPGLGLPRAVVEQYLALLAEDPLQFVAKSRDSGGGTYTVNLRTALTSLATATMESIVEERFGSRAARIFRLLLRRRHLEQKQVEDMAMVPAKEAKEALYTLLGEGFVSLQEIPRTPDHAPSRTFYLYTVHAASIARLLLQRCYKSVANLMERRQHETRENK
ncbi:DNA-directed RNA polymerase III subunit RPC3 [Cyrtonyx montezumae]|uniref:DNA-directed RNA polymerase III subunit RPC3 n=1 Tax=Cyrtonyx montezumae TaxID=9017 RepID=UPI0032DA735C